MKKASGLKGKHTHTHTPKQQIIQISHTLELITGLPKKGIRPQLPFPLLYFWQLDLAPPPNYVDYNLKDASDGF